MKKILLIEDEKLLGEMYTEKFTQAGLEVVWVDSAEKGAEVVLQARPDLILLDILLPRGNGIAFLNKLRGMPKGSDFLVIAFSNYDDPDAKKQAFDLGVKEYLIKTDYTPQQIIEKIKTWIGL